MNDELLAEILTAEREIRREIDALEERIAKEEETLRQELDQSVVNAAMTLQAERQEALKRAEQSALREADALLAKARSFASRLENLDNSALEGVIFRHLPRVLPKGAD